MARLLMEDVEWAFFQPCLIAVRGRGGRPVQIIAAYWTQSSGSQERVRRGGTGPGSSANGQASTASSGAGRRQALWEPVLDALNHSGVSPGQVQMIDEYNYPGPPFGGRRNRGHSERRFRTFKRWLHDQDPPHC